MALQFCLVPTPGSDARLPGGGLQVAWRNRVNERDIPQNMTWSRSHVAAAVKVPASLRAFVLWGAPVHVGAFSAGGNLSMTDGLAHHVGKPTVPGDSAAVTRNPRHAPHRRHPCTAHMCNSMHEIS
jgi:hypothetical protein